jgi:mannose-1-phosphate guanylyltransferase
VGGRSLIEATVERALSLVPVQGIRIVAGVHLRRGIQDLLPDLPNDCVLVEPEAKGTAPALAWAAWTLAQEDPGAVMVSLHSDHLVEPASALDEALREAARIAVLEDVLVCVGAEPDRAETGYGYILPGARVEAAGAFDASRAKAFVEKPDRETAERYVAQGYLWNTGIFVWSVRRFLQEIREVAPEIGQHLPLLRTNGPGAFFASCPAGTVDVRVMERSQRVVTLRATFEWDDIGSWEALSRALSPDSDQNVSVGQAHFFEGRRNVAYSESGTLVLFGVEDLITVQTPEVTLVMPRSMAPHLKRLLPQVPPQLRTPESES